MLLQAIPRWNNGVPKPVALRRVPVRAFGGKAEHRQIFVVLIIFLALEPDQRPRRTHLQLHVAVSTIQERRYSTGIRCP
jgi:hypothetical protein